MIKSLLVAVDSSAHARAALEHAVELAKVYQARLTGLYVLDVRYLEMPPYIDYSYAFEAVPPIMAPVDVMEKFKIKSERILNDVRDYAEKAGLQVEVRTEEGVPGQVVSDIGDTHDLVVLGKRGEHAKWGRDLLGSTAEAVARRSASPVLLTEETVRPIKKALVLYDGSHPAKRCLKFACDLGVHAGLGIKVLTVDDDEQRGWETAEEAKAYVEPLDVAATYSVLPGKPAKATAASLEEEPADLVTVGMRGHSSLRYLFLGRTAELVMRSIDLPVLMVP